MTLVGYRIVGVGIAVPGLVRASDGLVRDAPHLMWRDVALRDLVSTASGLPVVVGNDASMGVAAEHLFGAARGDGRHRVSQRRRERHRRRPRRERDRR